MVHVPVDLRGCAQVRTLFRGLCLTSFAEFAGSQDGDGLGLADAFVLAEVVDRFLAEGVETVVTVVEHLLHQVDGTLVGRAGADEDGQ